MRLWRSVHAEYNFSDIGGLEMLAQAAQVLDRAEALAARIAHDGEVIYTARGGPRAYPALKDELQARAFVCRTLQRLGLNDDKFKAAGRTGKPKPWDQAMRERD
jgi:hypothetical protein